MGQGCFLWGRLQEEDWKYNGPFRHIDVCCSGSFGTTSVVDLEFQISIVYRVLSSLWGVESKALEELRKMS